ncbi:hypothetical protein [Leuconostoc suionicum]|uniref:hypothetical protein n=2 Tax=Leuconostoc suionicum TaxID=1511761 RepID=UPI0021AB083A|nr:hypothetical protein [Leuconostoc suionicum]
MLSMESLRSTVGKIFFGILVTGQQVLHVAIIFFRNMTESAHCFLKKELLTLLSTNEDMKKYISKDERYKQYISPDNIVMSENGEFFAGLINMEYVQEIVNYLNMSVKNNI